MAIAVRAEGLRLTSQPLRRTRELSMSIFPKSCERARFPSRPASFRRPWRFTWSTMDPSRSYANQRENEKPHRNGSRDLQELIISMRFARGGLRPGAGSFGYLTNPDPLLGQVRVHLFS